MGKRAQLTCHVKPDEEPQSKNATPLVTPHIALDAQIFYGENFNFQSRRFQELKAHASHGRLKLYVTDISVREVRAGVKKRVSQALKAFKDARVDAQILKNVPSVWNVIPARDHCSEIVASLIEQFDAFLRETDATIISSRELPVGPLFDAYFEHRPPFAESGNKKAEFPDATSVAALIHWAEERREPIYVVSADSGVRDAAALSTFLLPADSLAVVLAMATASEAAATQRTSQAAAAQARYNAEIAKITQRIEEAFLDLGIDWPNYEYGEPRVDNVAVEDIKLGPALLTDMTATAAQFELEACITYTADLRYDDPEATVYDREDNVTHVFNRIHAEASGQIELPVAVTLELGDDGNWGDIVDVVVNDGEDVSLDPDEVREVGSDIDNERG